MTAVVAVAVAVDVAVAVAIAIHQMRLPNNLNSNQTIFKPVYNDIIPLSNVDLAESTFTYYCVKCEDVRRQIWRYSFI